MSEMTVQLAVEVLNKFKHNGHRDWRLVRRDEGVGVAACAGTVFRRDFEVVAIAEKYEREKHAELDRAIAVLNKHKHRGFNGWVAADFLVGHESTGAFVNGVPMVVNLSGPLYRFEILAIADRYDKEASK